MIAAATRGLGHASDLIEVFLLSARRFFLGDVRWFQRIRDRTGAAARIV